MEIGDKKYIFRCAVVRAATPHGGATADSDVGEHQPFLRIQPRCQSSFRKLRRPHQPYITAAFRPFLSYGVDPFPSPHFPPSK